MGVLMSAFARTAAEWPLKDFDMIQPHISVGEVLLQMRQLGDENRLRVPPFDSNGCAELVLFKHGANGHRSQRFGA